MMRTKMRINLVRLTLMAAVAMTSSVVTAQSLDFEVYRTRVEPIFSKRREGHARCVVCHSASNNAFKLQEWKPDTTA